mmetsp:Transcript_4238/g.12117  ORF Transcript_4238/g.12117 Transcript_4238/m.12117 type:complete len:219 (+) Transcript_4238:86-742(+)
MCPTTCSASSTPDCWEHSSPPSSPPSPGSWSPPPSPSPFCRTRWCTSSWSSACSSRPPASVPEPGCWHPATRASSESNSMRCTSEHRKSAPPASSQTARTEPSRTSEPTFSSQKPEPEASRTDTRTCRTPSHHRRPATRSNASACWRTSCPCAKRLPPPAAKPRPTSSSKVSRWRSPPWTSSTRQSRRRPTSRATRRSVSRKRRHEGCTDKHSERASE